MQRRRFVSRLIFALWEFSVPVCVDPEWEEQVRRKYQLYGKNRKVFLDGLQKYWDRGVVIRIDGKVAEASEWIKILEIQADGSFYMGDYVMEEQRAFPSAAMVCEDPGIYETQKEPEGDDKKACPELYRMGTLKEIRFDRVYNR